MFDKYELGLMLHRRKIKTFHIANTKTSYKGQYTKHNGTINHCKENESNYKRSPSTESSCLEKATYTLLYDSGQSVVWLHMAILFVALYNKLAPRVCYAFNRTLFDSHVVVSLWKLKKNTFKCSELSNSTVFICEINCCEGSGSCWIFSRYIYFGIAYLWL